MLKMLSILYNMLIVMSIAEELEAIERERARRRQIELAGKRNSDLEEMLPQGDGTTRRAPQTRDKVAAAVGLGSGRTYDKGANGPNFCQTFGRS